VCVLYLALSAFACRAELSALNGHRRAEKNIQLKNSTLLFVKNFHANESSEAAAWENIVYTLSFFAHIIEFLHSFSAVSRFGRKSEAAFLM
jgi:hypothetical protein